MSFLEHGYAIHPGILTTEQVARLRDAMSALPEDASVRRKRSVYGARHLLSVSPMARELAAVEGVRSLVTPMLGDEAFAVRAIFFDKVPGANWSLFWHQVKVIAVKERRAADGYVGWSRKSDVWQVQPPAEVLAEMVAVRLHLDDCFAGNGALRVIPGSHRSGWLDHALDDWKRRVPEVTCEASAGDAVLMCPLTLHASAPSEQPTHRRVIHIEYTAAELPGGLEWHDRVR